MTTSTSRNNIYVKGINKDMSNSNTKSLENKSVRVSMVSLGCSKNQIDGEMLLAALQNAGYTLSGDVGESDAVIVNTCGFIQSAKEEAIENILELAALKREGTIKAIVVTGCMAERYRDELLAEMPEVDVVVGIGANSQIVKAVETALGGGKGVLVDEKEALCIEGERVLTTMPYYAYLKIAEGCNNCCSYCAIPQIRGRFRSRTIESVVKEAEWLASTGVKELILVAQDTTRYGEDLYGEYSLARLLRELVKIEGFVWIRVLYCYPDKITDELLELMASEKKLAKYLDIPIQHCNAELLSSMNRSMDKNSLTTLIAHIRDVIPNITLRTTLIVGFPGETEEQFTELCEFAGEIKFDRLGCFAFSPEEGTKAALMEGQLDDEIKQRREEIIMTEQGFLMTRQNEKKIGECITVLVEGFDKFGECYFGRSEADAPEIDGKIFFTSKASHVMGDFVLVNITEVMDYDLVGEEKE